MSDVVKQLAVLSVGLPITGFARAGCWENTRTVCTSQVSGESIEGFRDLPVL